MTPLMWSANGGPPRHTQMVKLVLKAGANPLAADENGKTVLEMAREAQEVEGATSDVEDLLLEAIRKRKFPGKKKEL